MDIDSLNKLIQSEKEDYKEASPNRILLYCQIGQAYLNCGEVDELRAIEYYEKALADFEHVLLPHETDVLGNLGNLYIKISDYSKAQECVERELNILKNKLEEDQYALALAYSRLGHVAYDKQEYMQARIHYKQGLILKRKSRKLDDKDIADSYTNIGLTYLQNFGLVYSHNSELRKAEAYLRKALRLYKKAYAKYKDKRPIEVLIINTYENIGLLYLKQEKYAKSLSYLLNAYLAGMKYMENDRLFFANIAHNISVAYRNMGKCEEKMKWSQTAKSIFEKKSLELPTEIAYEFALFSHGLGRYQDALNVLQSLLSSKLSTLREIQIKLCIASSFEHLGREEEAKQQYYDLCEIFKTHFSNTLEEGNFCMNFGCFCHKRNDYDSALYYYKRALEIYDEKMPETLSQTSNCLSNLLLLQYDRGLSEIQPYLERCVTLIQEEFSEGMSIAREETRIKYFLNLRRKLSICLSILFSQKKNGDISTKYDLLMRTKNLNDQFCFGQELNQLKELNPEFARRVDRLQECHREYSKLFYGDQNENISKVDLEIEILELSFTTKTLAVTERKNIRRITLQEITDQLKDGEALLDFYCFEYRKPLPGKDNRAIVGDVYIAYLILNGEVYESNPISCVKVNAEITQLRKEIRAGNDGKIHLELLYTLLLSSFVKQLNEVKTLYISPESELFLLPFELLCKNKQYISFSEECRIVYLSSARALLEKEKNTWRGLNRAVIVAAPRFDMDIDKMEKGSEEKRSSDVNFKNIPEIPYAEIEADLIARKVKDVEMKLKNDATANVLLQPNWADVLHLSTHGFCEPLLSNDNDIDKGFLNCGLLFSGIQNGDLKNGLLTGYDIMTLDLSRYNLLILSACDTGIGNTMLGNGISGLRRAFELAGIPAMICTLWEVNDFSGALFMGHLYEELCDNRKSVSAALADTKIWMKNLTRAELASNPMVTMILENEKYYLYQEDIRNFLLGNENELLFQAPRYWAGFILQRRSKE